MNSEQHDKEKVGHDEQQQTTRLQPALEQLGTAKCPICRHDVAIYITKTKRPFLNCGFCSARIFFNGLASIRLLLDEMQPVPQTPQLGSAEQSRKEELI